MLEGPSSTVIQCLARTSFMPTNNLSGISKEAASAIISILIVIGIEHMAFLESSVADIQLPSV